MTMVLVRRLRNCVSSTYACGDKPEMLRVALKVYSNSVYSSLQGRRESNSHRKFEVLSPPQSTCAIAPFA